MTNIKYNQHPIPVNITLFYTLEVEMIMDPYNQGFDLPIESQYHLKDVIMSELACPLHIAPKPLDIPAFMDLLQILG